MALRSCGNFSLGSYELRQKRLNMVKNSFNAPIELRYPFEASSKAWQNAEPSVSKAPAGDGGPCVVQV